MRVYGSIEESEALAGYESGSCREALKETQSSEVNEEE